MFFTQSKSEAEVSFRKWLEQKQQNLAGGQWLTTGLFDGLCFCWFSFFSHFAHGALLENVAVNQQYSDVLLQISFALLSTLFLSNKEDFTRTCPVKTIKLAATTSMSWFSLSQIQPQPNYFVYIS